MVFHAATRPAVLLLAAASVCAAQPVWFGVKGGIRATGDLEGYATSESKRYVAGPTVEVALPRRFFLEFDALYSRFGYRTASSDFFGGFYQTSQRANVWEFPLLLKHRFGIAFAGLGYAPRVMTGSYHTVGASGVPGGSPVPYASGGATRYDLTHGLVAGGGIELAAGHVRIAPEVRYTRWNQDPVNLYGSHGFFVSGAQNEVKILLGLTWR